MHIHKIYEEYLRLLFYWTSLRKEFPVIGFKEVINSYFMVGCNRLKSFHIKYDLLAKALCKNKRGLVRKYKARLKEANLINYIFSTEKSKLYT